jgi:hypothetical protein
MGRTLLIAATVVVLITLWHDHTGLRYPPGILVPGEPEQTMLSTSDSWQRGAYRIEPLARYDITARVLDTRSYWMGRDSNVSPIDFAVAWGVMSDQAMLDQFHYSNGSRHLYIRLRGDRLPLPMEEVNAHVANMHLIPASDAVQTQLEAVSTGQIVALGGYLVQVRGPDGFFWKSSLSRTDTGDGACELMWVEQLSVR